MARGGLEPLTGGATSANSAPAINELANSRYGFAFSQPIGPGFSAKLAWSHWLTGQYGQNFSTVGLQLQYRWFREGTARQPVARAAVLESCTSDRGRGEDQRRSSSRKVLEIVYHCLARGRCVRRRKGGHRVEADY